MNPALLAAANRRPTETIVLLDTIAKLVNDVTGWSSDAYGFSSSARYSYSNGFLPANGFKLAAPGIDLSKVRKFSASFTHYVNTPVNCLGYNQFKITLSDNSFVYVGVSDQNSDGAQPVHVYDGSTVATRPAGNIINRTLSYTVPNGLTVTKIEVCSAAYAQYARGNFGFKDVTLTLAV